MFYIIHKRCLFKFHFRCISYFSKLKFTFFLFKKLFRFFVANLFYPTRRKWADIRQVFRPVRLYNSSHTYIYLIFDSFLSLQCCACYGPPGGKDVYCYKKCQAVNGGTVTKHASAWFWVRLNPPRKVWEKCMEYKSENENGESAWYKLLGDRNIPVNVSINCLRGITVNIANLLLAAYRWMPACQTCRNLTILF